MTKLSESKKMYFNLVKWRDDQLSPIGKWLLSRGVSANTVSLFRIAMVLPMFYCVGPLPLAAFLILFLNYLLDGLDGMMARASKTTSMNGRVLDVSIDNFYVVPVVLALIWYNLAAPFWAALYLVNVIADYFIVYLKKGIEAENYPFFFNRYFVYFALLLYGLGGPNWFDLVMIFWGVTLIIVNGYNLYDLYRKK